MKTAQSITLFVVSFILCGVTSKASIVVTIEQAPGLQGRAQVVIYEPSITGDIHTLSGPVSKVSYLDSATASVITSLGNGSAECFLEIEVNGQNFTSSATASTSFNGSANNLDYSLAQSSYVLRIESAEPFYFNYSISGDATVSIGSLNFEGTGSYYFAGGGTYYLRSELQSILGWNGFSIVSGASESSSSSVSGSFSTVPEPAPTEYFLGISDWPILESGWVNTEEWMGWVWVRNQPWIFSNDLNRYIYLDEGFAGPDGGWIYTTR